jgi:hypothetical protein
MTRSMRHPTIQYTAFPLGVDPELGVKFNITAPVEQQRTQGRARAEQIWQTHGWLDAGVREMCVVDRVEL